MSGSAFQNTQKGESRMTRQSKVLSSAEAKARKSETENKIASLSGGQARVALYAIAQGKTLPEALALARTYIEL